MKTLKKTLCLVLAVVLAVGVLVIPAYAETDSYNSFTDKDDVDYKYEEALATLTGMGIFNGKSSTSASPKASLTRAEAVTLIARALLGEGDWTLPKAPTQFSDVPASHYASGYVAYATEQGIVAGKSRTTFAPNDLVTGYELAKMLLVATGIKTNFTAAKWQMESGPLASQKGLLVGLEGITDLNKALTREEAAQLIWNAVKYSETLSFVVTDPKKEDYTVKFPEDSIGGRVFGLTAHYSYDKPSTGVDSDVFNRPAVEWSNGKTGAEKEVYSNITQRPLVQFYAGQALLVSDLRAKLGLSVSSAKGLTFKVFVDGSTASESSGTLQALDNTTNGKSVFANTVPASTRGATVSIYPGISGATYDVYVVYPYATALHDNPTDGELQVKWPTGVDTTKVGTLKKGDVITFNLTKKYGDTRIVNLRSESPAMNGMLNHRNNDSRDPYVRIGGKKLYFSANAVVISKKNSSTINVASAYYTSDDITLGKYYDVWLDDAGNILALQETDGPVGSIDFDDFGYVLEFSYKPGQQTVHVHDNEYGTEKACKTAEAKVTMVSLKTGVVGIYDLKILQEGTECNEKWYIAGVDGTKWINYYEIPGNGVTSIKNPVNGVTDEHNQDGTKKSQRDATILHGFVAYKNLGGGYYGITTIENLNQVGIDVKYMVVNDFTTDKDVPGRVQLTGRTLYADNDTHVYTLNGHTSVADGSRVNSYKVTELESYKKLGDIATNSTKVCDAHVSKVNGITDAEFLGTGALFIYNSKTNMVQNAYIFATDPTATEMNDLYIFLGRGESVYGVGTEFNFIHNGKEISLLVDETDVDEMELLLDNALDAVHYPVITFRLNSWGSINVDTIAIKNTTDSEVSMFTVDGFVKDGYVATGTTLYYMASGCYVFDASTGKVVENPTSEWMKGKSVYLYYAEAASGKHNATSGHIAIVWVEDTANPKHATKSDLTPTP